MSSSACEPGAHLTAKLRRLGTAEGLGLGFRKWARTPQPITSRSTAYCLLFNLATREAISSVILSSQRVGLTPALYTAGKQKGQQAQAASPLVIDGQKLIPSVTRVFSKAKALYIYLQAYQQGDAPVNPLVAYATFYADGQNAFETTAIQIVEATPDRLKTMPLRFRVPLDKLAEGEYTCQVSVLDFNG
jgi:hypothetical protein